MLPEDAPPRVHRQGVNSRINGFETVSLKARACICMQACKPRHQLPREGSRVVLIHLTGSWMHGSCIMLFSCLRASQATNGPNHVVWRRARLPRVGTDTQTHAHTHTHTHTRTHTHARNSQAHIVLTLEWALVVLTKISSCPVLSFYTEY